MKQILCALLIVLATQVQADNYEYPFLVLTKGNGSQVALSVEGLEVTFENGQLVAKNTSGSSQFTLAELASMQFSKTNDGTENSVNGMTADSREDSETLYDLSGRRAYRQGTAIRKGLYVVRKANGETSKILVK